MSPQIADKLKDIGLDPIVPLPICAEVIGISTQTVKNIARRGEAEDYPRERTPLRHPPERLGCVPGEPGQPSP